jgi:hypothetical protein
MKAAQLTPAASSIAVSTQLFILSYFANYILFRTPRLQNRAVKSVLITARQWDSLSAPINPLLPRALSRGCPSPARLQAVWHLASPSRSAPPLSARILSRIRPKALKLPSRPYGSLRRSKPLAMSLLLLRPLLPWMKMTKALWRRLGLTLTRPLPEFRPLLCSSSRCWTPYQAIFTL